MALKTYVGARYAPKFSGAWNKANEYSALEVVYANNQSYVSRKTVPANTEITNTEYWMKSSDWNAQVAQYNANVEQYNTNVEQYNTNVEKYEQNVSSFYADTMHSYDTKEDMVNDETLKLGETLLTCGNAAVGDGGGGFWQVVNETSANAVALKNGLFALRVQLEPYNTVVFHDNIPENTKTGSPDIIFNISLADASSNGIHLYNKPITTTFTDAAATSITAKISSTSTLMNNGIIKLYISPGFITFTNPVPITVTDMQNIKLCTAMAYNNSTIGINLYMINGRIKYADTFTKEVAAPAVMPSELVTVTGTASVTVNAGVLTLSQFNANHKCPTRVININKTYPGFTTAIESLKIDIQTNNTTQRASDIFNGETIIAVNFTYSNFTERNIAITLSVNGNDAVGTTWIGGNKYTGNSGIVSNHIKFLIKITGADSERFAQIIAIE